MCILYSVHCTQTIQFRPAIKRIPLSDRIQTLYVSHSFYLTKSMTMMGQIEGSGYVGIQNFIF